MTVPSNACKRSLSPSLILTCTRMVSPGRNSGWPTVRLFLFRILVITALFISWSSIPMLPTNPAAAAPSFPAPPSAATSGSPRGCRRAASPAPSSRETPPAGVLRAIQHALLAERFVDGRVLVPQHAFLQPRHRIDHHRRGQFSAAQHIVADRNLFVGQVLRPRAHPRPHTGRRSAAAPAPRPAREPAPDRTSAPAPRAKPRAGSGARAPARSTPPPQTSAPAFSTIPSPPPKGRSSTVRCRSRVQRRKSCTRISIRPDSRAF